MYNTNSLENCINLIERHAPRLLRQGGGALIGDKQMFVVTKQTISDIIRLYKEGVKSSVIAKQLGCSKPTVSKYLRINKIRASYLRPAMLTVTPEAVAEMIKLHNQGENLTSIAQKLKYSKPTVIKYLRLEGKPIPPQHIKCNQKIAA